MAVYKRGDKWYIDVKVKGHPRVRRSVSGSRQIAKIAESDLRLKLERGEFVKNITPMTFRELAIQYLEHVSSVRSHNTYINDRYAMQAKLIPYFGDRNLEAITPTLIEQFKKMRLSEGMKPSTINKDLGRLHALFNRAIDWNYARENPVKKVDLLRVPETEVRFLTQDEITRLLEAARSGPSYLYPFIYTALNTGLRRSELYHLWWSDVDFDRNRVTVQSKPDWNTKTYGKRIIPLNAGVVDMLRHHIRLSEYVFCHSNGQRIVNGSEALAAAYKRAGLPMLGFHIFRHTFASHLVMAGVDIRTVQTLLGHKDITMTMRYAHLAPEHVSDAVEKLTYDTSVTQAEILLDDEKEVEVLQTDD